LAPCGRKLGEQFLAKCTIGLELAQFASYSASSIAHYLIKHDLTSGPKLKSILML